MLLELAPGLRVVRRGPHHLQVGLYDDRRAVLPRTDHVLEVVRRIAEREPVALAEPGVASAVGHLVATGCAMPSLAIDGARRRRRRAHVEVLGTLGPGMPDAAALLAAAGLGTDHDDDEPAAVLVLVRGEPDRSLFDPFLRRGQAHLVVRVVDGAVVVGPFVVPGRSACVRCLDAHRSAEDPDHVAVLARYVAATRGPRRDGRDDLAEPVLAHLGLAWAVRDLTVHVDGGRPTTWSSTVRLGPEVSGVVRTTWPPHPDCGCCWPGSLPAWGTMEA
jgi:bacteriocin biosynthesis cyclodehydratase domain-containing protein